jgi:predicted transcriptional regulator of viral defense system
MGYFCLVPRAVPHEPFAAVRQLFRAQGGTLRMSEALRQGVPRRTLYAMRDAGVIEAISRGLYRLRELGPLGRPDLVAVALRIPDGVICLLSALALHELTTQIPHAVHVAIERDRGKPARIDHPPVQVHRFSGAAFHEGIEVHRMDGTAVRIYGPEKSVADVFKYRNKLGLDVALEALRLWSERRGRSPQTLITFARHCRVERVMRPYLEALL